METKTAGTGTADAAGTYIPYKYYEYPDYCKCNRCPHCGKVIAPGTTYPYYPAWPYPYIPWYTICNDSSSHPGTPTQ